MGLDFDAKGYKKDTPHWSYGGFMWFRGEIAKTIGIPDLRTHYDKRRPFPKDDISDFLTHSDCDDVLTHKQCARIGPRLKEILNYVRQGDSLVITKLDRLARSTYQLTKIAEELKEKGVDLVVMDQNIDTSTPTGKLFFDMLASIAEFEAEIRKERDKWT